MYRSMLVLAACDDGDKLGIGQLRELCLDGGVDLCRQNPAQQAHKRRRVVARLLSQIFRAPFGVERSQGMKIISRVISPRSIASSLLNSSR
jgi:hypothetical protein